LKDQVYDEDMVYYKFIKLSRLEEYYYLVL